MVPIPPMERSVLPVRVMTAHVLWSARDLKIAALSPQVPF
uniref:Uncharacterized protein n=1 Tax=Anguilla anguilla TaxID=7936 RepID=A0A0E9X9I0_ANGAN